MERLVGRGERECGMRIFDPLRTAEEELRNSAHCGLRRRI
jgi:hypothetical protein